MSKPVSYAQSLLTHYWDKTIPVQPEQIIKKISDLELRYEDFPDNVSGMKYYDFKKGIYVIAVNQNHHKNRQRFTMAHELGHYALNHGNKTDTVYRDSSLESNSDEVEANAFAAEILMPTGVIRKLVLEQEITTVETLAFMLWVSEQAMLYRLKNLGLIS